MKLKMIGMIGTIAGAVLGVTGFGLMMGGGFATHTDKIDTKIPQIGTIKITTNIGAFNVGDSYNQIKKEIKKVIKKLGLNWTDKQISQAMDAILQYMEIKKEDIKNIDYWDSIYSKLKYDRGNSEMTIKQLKRQIKDAKQNNQPTTDLEQQLKDEKKTLKNLQEKISAGDMVIAGAALFSIFTIVAIGSGVLWFLKRSE